VEGSLESRHAKVATDLPLIRLTSWSSTASDDMIWMMWVGGLVLLRGLCE
jgi:hypothetical protein